MDLQQFKNIAQEKGIRFKGGDCSALLRKIQDFGFDSLSVYKHLQKNSVPAFIPQIKQMLFACSSHATRFNPKTKATQLYQEFVEGYQISAADLPDLIYHIKNSTEEKIQAKINRLTPQCLTALRRKVNLILTHQRARFGSQNVWLEMEQVWRGKLNRHRSLNDKISNPQDFIFEASRLGIRKNEASLVCLFDMVHNLGLDYCTTRRQIIEFTTEINYDVLMRLIERVEKKVPRKDFKTNLYEVWDYLVLQMKMLPLDFSIFLELYYKESNQEQDKIAFHTLQEHYGLKDNFRVYSNLKNTLDDFFSATELRFRQTFTTEIVRYARSLMFHASLKYPASVQNFLEKEKIQIQHLSLLTKVESQEDRETYFAFYLESSLKRNSIFSHQLLHNLIDYSFINYSPLKILTILIQIAGRQPKELASIDYQIRQWFEQSDSLGPIDYYGLRTLYLPELVEARERNEEEINRVLTTYIDDIIDMSQRPSLTRETPNCLNYLSKCLIQNRALIFKNDSMLTFYMKTKQLIISCSAVGVEIYLTIEPYLNFTFERPQISLTLQALLQLPLNDTDIITMGKAKRQIKEDLFIEDFVPILIQMIQGKSSAKFMKSVLKLYLDRQKSNQKSRLIRLLANLNRQLVEIITDQSKVILQNFCECLVEQLPFINSSKNREEERAMLEVYLIQGSSNTILKPFLLTSVMKCLRNKISNQNQLFNMIYESVSTDRDPSQRSDSVQKHCINEFFRLQVESS